MNVSNWVDEGDNAAFEINESLFELLNSVSEVYNGAFEISEVASQVQNAAEYVKNAVFEVTYSPLQVRNAAFELNKGGRRADKGIERCSNAFCVRDDL